MTDHAYDIETYPNCFTCTIQQVDQGEPRTFEISDYKNEAPELINYLRSIGGNGDRLVGYNNLGFDYPVIHMLMQMGHQVTANVLYEKAMAIINSQNGPDKWVHMVRPKNRFIEQLDLYKIHHFDNSARATSLKILEFNMRMDNIQDLPFPVGTVLNQEQIQTLIIYNQHDVEATIKFYHESKAMIEFRETLTKKYGRDFMNHNDTKIGKDYFIMQLEAAGVQCYEYGPDGRQPRQTKRDCIPLNDVILPWIQFRNPEFQRVANWLRQQTITETKGVFKDLTATVGGIDYVFGLGGIHASVQGQIFESDDEYVIMDIDVEAYYPSTAIAQRFKPAQYPDIFCDIYADLKQQRKNFPKGTPENAMLKLALNGVYGDTNSKFSVFYDPYMTMGITLNGQLLLCLLAENLITIEGLKIIQVNTDGMTVRMPRKNVPYFRFIVQWWESITNLTMEEAEYSRMFVRDVNNYIAEYAA